MIVTFFLNAEGEAKGKQCCGKYFQLLKKQEDKNLDYWKN